jgi:hypothetical protein
MELRDELFWWSSGPCSALQSGGTAPSRPASEGCRCIDVAHHTDWPFSNSILTEFAHLRTLSCEGSVFRASLALSGVGPLHRSEPRCLECLQIPRHRLLYYTFFININTSLVSHIIKNPGLAFLFLIMRHPIIRLRCHRSPCRGFLVCPSVEPG